MSPPNSWGDNRGNLSHHLRMRSENIGRRRTRRLCRRFAHVGVETSPKRLREILAGGIAGADELTDVNFAFIATQLGRDARAARLKRLKRRGTRSLIFAGLVLVVLNFLFCMAYLLLNLAQQGAAA
jgi:hypothetical protein